MSRVASPAAHDPAGLAEARILVVDDRAENLLVVKTMLEGLGPEIVTARSGEEALKRLLENDFAVVLLDVNMPGMDGLETATYIRSRARNQHTPIIFLTAYVEEMHTVRGYSLGAVDYILTPVMPEVLRGKVKVFVRLYLMTREAERQADQRIALAREQAARAAAEESTRRSAFLAEAWDRLGSSLDTEATVKALAAFVVPTLADVGALMLTDEHGRVQCAELAWRGADGMTHSEAVTGLQHPELEAAMRDAFDSGRIEFLWEAGRGRAPLLAARCGEDSPRALDPACEPEAMALVPLTARGRRLGILILGRHGRPFDDASLALAADLGVRAAVALDNCLLYASIQEADRRKNEFLAMLAHELRNPLAPVRNAVHVLRSRGGSDWPLEVIDRQSTQLVRLVDDLLDVSRVTQGRIVLKLEPVDVAGVVAMAVETSRPLIDRNAHDLSVSLPAHAVYVHGDRSRIAQILANLVNNAAKYTEPGGRVALAVEEVGEEVVFTVRDSGVGIPENMLASIFELFVQADRSLDRSQGGLGIGLTIVHRLVTMLGGSVHAASDGPGKGSAFSVRLPRGAYCAVPESAPATRRALAKRILVVDDYLDAAESMAAVLQAERHEVRIARDGLTAIEAARAFRPSAVLLDIGLPGMTGYEVARALRAMPETRDSLLIAVTGYGQAEDQALSREAGFNFHLVKPVDPEALRAILDSAAAAVPTPEPEMVIEARRA